LLDGDYYADGDGDVDAEGDFDADGEPEALGDFDGDVLELGDCEPDGDCDAEGDLYPTCRSPSWSSSSTAFKAAAVASGSPATAGAVGSKIVPLSDDVGTSP
jgi:hypothetical protein